MGKMKMRLKLVAITMIDRDQTVKTPGVYAVTFTPADLREGDVAVFACQADGSVADIGLVTEIEGRDSNKRKLSGKDGESIKIHFNPLSGVRFTPVALPAKSYHSKTARRCSAGRRSR